MTRKHNRLLNWDYSSEGLYFVTICTIQKQSSLGRIVPHISLSAYGEIAERYLRTIPGIIRFCIMPNYIHALILVSQGSMWASTPTQSIPQRILSFKTIVTKECGTPLFQRSYYDHIVRNEKDYLRICAYIDNNPAEWAKDEYYL